MLHPLIPKILILESQMIIAADISLQFSKLGYEVVGINTTPEDAMKTIEVNRPDIVLINTGLKSKINRFKTSKMIWDSFQIPFVFISSHSDKETFKRVIAAQPYAYISKPFEKKDLQRGIETALNRMVAEGRWT